MADNISSFGIPVPEKALRDLARNASRSLPNFAEKEPAIGVKELHEIVDPIIVTTDLPDLSPSHRAAASNALCAVIESCQVSATGYAREEILSDSIWLRTFGIYLQRSENAKGKSMRQILLVLTSVITKHDSPRAHDLRRQAAATFMDIIQGRQDRLKVKPALQGLAHFLLRDVVPVVQLVDLYRGLLERSSTSSKHLSLQKMFQAFLSWIVHHDTSLSAGHLIKNFLIQARKVPHYLASTQSGLVTPLWIEPVVSTLREWPDRMQEFKTHVFPHCFLPNIEEYLRFLSYMRFGHHVEVNGVLPGALNSLRHQTNGLDTTEEFRILLAAIEAGKELNIVHDDDFRVCRTLKIHSGAVYLPDNIFGPWMSHTDPEVRLAGMFLSIHSTAVTRPMTAGLFKHLKQNLVHLHTDTDAYFRRDVNGYTQKLFDRLRASTATLAKLAVKASNSSATRLPVPKSCYNHGAISSKAAQHDVLIESLSFIVWYIRFLEWELRSTASYQRRITALQSLTIVLRSGIDPGVPQSHLSKSAQGQLNWAHSIQIANPKLTRALMDLILDPFDDIRNLAVSVLQLCLLAQPIAEQDFVLDAMRPFLERADSMQLSTGRADQADGVARAYSLLYSLLDNHRGPQNPTMFSSSLDVFLFLRRQLQSTLSFAGQNLSEAVNGLPVHGTFAALRYIIDQDNFYDSLSIAPAKTFEQWKEAHDEILDGIEAFWSCIQHILCIDAPEGHVPDEIDEEANLDTKEILSYSWRGLKEASVLLRVMTTKAPIGYDGRALLSPDLFERLGRLCFTQLLELRHRGAFSTVSQTFAAFCRRCVSSDIPALRALPERWYQETFRSIQAKAGAITRRSAGIPALMASIMAADTGKLFPRAMTDLIGEASIEAQSTNIEESRLPQVHAINCVKEFFTTSRLKVASEAYMGQGLELAAKTLNSNIWPIRNCSLMLFKALIERLLGSSEAQDWKELERARTSRFSYDDYPSLVGILSDLLNPEGPLKQSLENTPDNSSPLDLHGAEGVFPALQILRQARPPDANLEMIVASVEKLFASPHWHLRDMAARTVVSLRPVHQFNNAAFTLLSAEYKYHNLQHGALLAVKHMIRKLLHDPHNLGLEEFGRLMQKLSKTAKQWYIPSECPFTRAAFLDTVSICGLAMLRRSDATTILDAWDELATSVSLGPEYALKVIDASGGALLRQSLAQVFFIDRVILRDHSLALLVSTEYQSIGDALLLLAIEDQDTCCTGLETLDRVLKVSSSSDITIPLDLVLAHIHRVLLEATDAEVISKAQSVLANNLLASTLSRSFLALLTQQQVFFTLTKLESQCLTGPPSNTQSALHLLGPFLDHAYATYTSQHQTILSAIARYIRLLRTTIIETNPFDTRLAAAQSLCALKNIWLADPSSRTTSPILLSLSLLLHALLNDDDDQIRSLAALATCHLLHRAPTAPIPTSHCLAAYLTTTFRHTSILATQALRRLTLLPTPFETLLAAASSRDTALFATEKQNLYKDPVSDAVYWSRILVASLPYSRASRAVALELKTWVLHALRVVAQMARDEVDGALGWVSRDGVFALVMRVVCAAEVCLDREVMVALRGFADLGVERGVHGLILARVEGVLEKGVLRMLRGAKKGLVELEG